MATKAPAKYSIYQDDFDLAFGSRIRVFIEGVLQTHVLSYDTEKGMVERYVVDDNGEVKFDPVREQVMTEKLYGELTVEIDL